MVTPGILRKLGWLAVLLMSVALLHFELRPVAPGNTRTDKAWTERYAKVPDVEWSRYEPVDPQKFDTASFGGVRKATK